LRNFFNVRDKFIYTIFAKCCALLYNNNLVLLHALDIVLHCLCDIFKLWILLRVAEPVVLKPALIGLQALFFIYIASNLSILEASIPTEMETINGFIILAFIVVKLFFLLHSFQRKILKFRYMQSWLNFGPSLLFDSKLANKIIFLMLFVKESLSFPTRRMGATTCCALSYNGEENYPLESYYILRKNN